MKVFILAATAIAALLTATFTSLYIALSQGVFLTLAITAGTFFYHFAMRLAVGYLVSFFAKNRIRYGDFWFRERKFERKLYAFLQVKKWKKRMPTYSPNSFSLKERTLGEVITETCVAELVHELIILLSFLPLVAAVFFGEFFVFLATSVAAALIDSIFVIMQRYNRPRLISLLRRMGG